MYKNPLHKFQKGGAIGKTNPEDAEKSFIKMMANSLQVSEDIIKARLDEIKNSEEESVIFSQAMQLASSSDETESTKGKEMLISLFTKQTQKSIDIKRFGGKIKDFLCKYANGGNIDCGCKQGGGTVGLDDRLRGYTYMERRWLPNGFAEYTIATDRSHLPSNLESDPNSRYNLDGGDYLGDGQIRITDNGQGKLFVDDQPYVGYVHDMVHGADSASYVNHLKKLIKKIGMQPSSGLISSKQSGGIVNGRRRTVVRSMDDDNYNRYTRYDAEADGIDPNTLMTGVVVTAYPNNKSYIVDGMVPFNKRNGLLFNIGGIESGATIEGDRISRGVSGRTYRVSSIFDQDDYNPISYNSNAMEYPFITRYASPVDTLYRIDFKTIDRRSPAYSGVRDMYNSAIRRSDTMAVNKDAYSELYRQKKEMTKQHQSGGTIDNGFFGFGKGLTTQDLVME